MTSIIVFLLQGLASIVSIVIHIGILLLVVRAIISWVSPNPRNPIVQFVRGATDPFVNRIKALVRTVYWRLDFAPVIGVTILVFTERTMWYLVAKIIEWLG